MGYYFKIIIDGSGKTYFHELEDSKLNTSSSNDNIKDELLDDIKNHVLNLKTKNKVTTVGLRYNGVNGDYIILPNEFIDRLNDSIIK